MQMPSHLEMTRTTQIAPKTLSVRTGTTRVSNLPLKVPERREEGSPAFCRILTCLLSTPPNRHAVSLALTVRPPCPPCLLSLFSNLRINWAAVHSLATCPFFVCQQRSLANTVSVCGPTFLLWSLGVHRQTTSRTCGHLGLLHNPHHAFPDLR